MRKAGSKNKAVNKTVVAAPQVPLVVRGLRTCTINLRMTGLKRSTRSLLTAQGT